MLGFLRGIEKGVEREGAARRAHYGTLLSSKDNHLDRLLSQIRYNQQQKRLSERDARQDFVTDRAYDRSVKVTDRAYDRSVIESDRNYKLRQDAENRAAELHPLTKQNMQGIIESREKQNEFLYGTEGQPGYNTLRRELLEGEVEEWDANAPLRELERLYKTRFGEYQAGIGLDTLIERDRLGLKNLRTQTQLGEAEYNEYMDNDYLRRQKRAYEEKLLGHNLGEGWQNYLKEGAQRRALTQAQIDYYGRRGTTTTTPGGQKPYRPTFSQAGDITADSIAPVILQHLETEGEHAVMPWHPDAQVWPPGFQADRPWTSTNPNELTQTKLLRRAGAELVKELTLHRGLSRQNAMQMVPYLWDEFLTTENGKKILKRLERTAQADGYDPFKLHEEMRKILYKGAWNYMHFGAAERPAGVETPDADKILDMELP